MWPTAEIVDAEIQAHLRSAFRRIAELCLVRVVLAASVKDYQMPAREQRLAVHISV